MREYILSKNTMDTLKALEICGNMYAREVADVTQRSVSAARSSLAILNKRNMAHISSYGREEGSNHYEAIWAAGAGVNASKPRPMTQTEKSRAHRARHKARMQLLQRTSKKPLNFWSGLIN